MRRVKIEVIVQHNDYRCLLTLAKNPCSEQFSKLFKESVDNLTFNVITTLWLEWFEKSQNVKSVHHTTALPWTSDEAWPHKKLWQ